jgi:plastocyanin
MRSHIRLVIPLVTVLAFCIVASSSHSASTPEDHTRQRPEGALRSPATEARTTRDVLCDSHSWQRRQQQQAATAPFGTWGEAFDSSAPSSLTLLASDTSAVNVFAPSWNEEVWTIDALPDAGEPFFLGMPDDKTEVAAADPLRPAQIVDVKVGAGGDNVFDPVDPVINVGDTVRWTWDSPNHTVTSGSGCTSDNQYCSPNNTNCSVGSASNTGFIYTHTFNTPGTYPYFCKVHCGTFNMKGTITVQGTASTFSISGKITTGGNPVSGVTMHLSGAQTATDTTDSTGSYSFTGLATGNYTVMPEDIRYTFTPGNRSYTALSANQANQDYTATPEPLTISGQVRQGTTGLVGVTMTLTSPTPAGFTPRTVMTDSTGHYSLTNVPAGRNYTLTPSKSGFTFKNTSNTAQSTRTYTNLSQNQTNQDFTATATTTGFTISGFVKVGTTALAGVTMKLASPTPAGFTTRTLQTTSTGSYSFTNVPGGRNYTLTPVKTGYAFTPTSKSYTNLSANQANQNFAAGIAYTISGLVKVGTTALAGVTMKLTSPTPAGFTPRTVLTTSTGSYSFANVPGGRSYILTPTKTNYTFTPTSKSYSNLSASQTNQNFAATLKTYTISGRVTQAGTTTGIAAVTMTLASPTPAGFTTRTLQTNSTGGFSFTNVPAARNYTLTPSKSGLTFTPTSRSYTNLSANQTGAAASFSGMASTPSPSSTVEFTESSYRVSEGDGQIQITVARSGDTSAPATVDYEVNDGSASDRSDYSTTLGTLGFAPGETSKTFTIFITDDAYVEQDETMTLTLGNATNGVEVGNQPTAVLTITDNDTDESAANPIDDPAFFVRQHYVDFLSSDDLNLPATLAVDLNYLKQCGAGDEECQLTLSSEVFRDSAIFMQRGLFIYRLYKATLARPPLYREFVRDMRELAKVSTGGDALSQYAAFLNEWMEHPAFRERYGMLSDRDFLAKLLKTAGKVAADRELEMANALESGDLTRYEVLNNVLRRRKLSSQEKDAAFVSMLYFGYLRRDPDEEGFKALLETRRQHPKDDRPLIEALINSVEYRSRFGRP